MDTELIVLDSDDEETRNAPVNGSALASIAIVNAKPLDLDALGIGSLRPDDGVLSNNQNTRYFGGTRQAEERPQSYNTAANRIKSNTAVSYMQTVTPISPTNHRPSQSLGYEANRPRILARSDVSIGINAVALLGNTAPRSMQPRSAVSTHLSSRQGNSPSFRNTQPRIVSESRLQNYNFEVNGEKSSDSDRQLCPSLRFRCQYPNCRRVVTGNVSFVCHLWAHIVTWKEYDPKSPTFPVLCEGVNSTLAITKRNDVDVLSTCPSCTARFHTPYLMQVHYTRCHSRQPQAVNRATCTICEKDVRLDVKGGMADALRTHLVAHEPNDAPYHCKRCRYRCTVRMHLFNHFEKEHKNTSTLMCPFCTFTLVVPSYLRKRPVIRATEFVAHMISHESEARMGCDNCALSFSNVLDKQKHRREHSAVNPKWTFTYRNPETRTRPRSRLICPEQKPKYQCTKCANSSDSCSRKKCLACVALAFNDSLYGRRRAATDTSVRRGIDSLQCAQRGMRFTCKCGMSTRNGNRMAQHFYYCRKDFELIDTDDELVEPTVADETDDKLEAQLFSVHHKMEPVMPSAEAVGEHGNFQQLSVEIVRLSEEVSEGRQYDKTQSQNEESRPKVVERKRRLIEPPMRILEVEVSDMSTSEDLERAVLFYRKCTENTPLTSIVSFRDILSSYDFC